MRFYAVCTEAIQLTHRALQQLDQERRGSRQPSRSLRVATLYGHLQTRADAGGAVQLALRDLAAAWNLQPRLLREDLSDLQALGWLHYSSDWRGTVIHLHKPLLPRTRWEQAGPQSPVAAPAASAAPSTVKPGTPIASAPAAAAPAARPVLELPEAALDSSDPSTGCTVPATCPADQALMARFAEVYNRHKPQAWPAYNPRGTALAARLRRGIRHAGGDPLFWPLMAQALRAMPEFWRSTYPRGRSGADCAAALLSADRHAAGLGPDFWHVLSWGTAAIPAGGGAGVAEASAERTTAQQDPDYRRACRLLAWDGHTWLGVGMEAVALPDHEKQRLAELLEAAGFGSPGQAARQFAATGNN